MPNIVKTFAGSRYTEPKVPPIPPVARMPTPYPDEQAAQALAFVGRLNDEVGSLRERCAHLQADLNVQLMRVRDLEDERLVLRSDMEAYRRYSVEVKSHLQTLIDVARRANEAALEAGEAMHVDKHTKEVLEETERDVRDMAKKLSPLPDDPAA